MKDDSANPASLVHLRARPLDRRRGALSRGRLISAPHAPQPAVTGQALHAPVPRPQRAFPRRVGVLHDKEPDSRPGSPQSPAAHTSHMPHQHRAEISIFAFPLVISKIRILLRQQSNLKPAGLRPAGKRLRTRPSCHKPGKHSDLRRHGRRLTAPTRHFTPSTAPAAEAAPRCVASRMTPQDEPRVLGLARMP